MATPAREHRRIVSVGKRPEPYPYAFSALRSLPKRLMNPPSAGVEKSSSFKISPAFKVKLEDVLNSKHLPPLGLLEFQDYLTHTEYSVENLHFFRWLKDYSTSYTGYHIAETKDVKLAQKLHSSYVRARATFLTPGATHELNLSSLTITAFNVNVAPVAPGTPPPPQAFAEVRRQVELMLRESLVRFVSANCGNAGRKRGLFAIGVGLITIVLGLVPIILSFLPSTASNHSRWVRVTAFVPFWLGAATLLAGLHGVCVIIYLFGDARQLYPCELARLAISAPIQIPVSILTTSENATRSGASLPGVTFLLTNKQQKPAPDSESHREFQTNGDVFDEEDASSDKGSYLTSSIPSPTSKPPSLVFDFDALTPATPATTNTNDSFLGEEKSSSGSMFSRSMSSEFDRNSREMWSPLTKVVSPIVTRSQWEIFTRSALIGFLFGLIICIILVPL